MIISIVGYGAAVVFIILVHVKKGLSTRILGGILFAICKYIKKQRFQILRYGKIFCMFFQKHIADAITIFFWKQY